MSKMKKLYQARRILAVILAVTMVFGMVPETVHAAAPDNQEMQTVADSTVETPMTEEIADSSSDEKETDPAADGNNAAGTDEPAADGTGAADTDGSAAGNDETADSDESADNGDGTDGNNVSGENNAAGADSPDADSPAEGEDDTAAEPDQTDSRAEKPVYEILTDDLATTAEYTGYSVFDLSSVLLRKTENGSVYTENALDAGVTAAWAVQGADGKYTPIVSAPVSAGSYELTLSFAKEPDVHDGAEKKVLCEITKAPVTIVVGSNEDGKVSVKAGMLKENAKPEIGRVNSAGYAIDAEDIVLTVSMVRDAITGAEIKNGTKLTKAGDYVMDITPSFKADAAADRKEVYANYELKPFTADIVIEELIETLVEVTLAGKWQTEEGPADWINAKEYDGKPVDAPKVTDDYTYEIKYFDDTKGEYVKLEGAEAHGAWEEYEGCTKDKDGKVEAPVEAGSYIYNVIYAGETGIYGDSYAGITVEISPALLTVETANKGPVTFLEGTTVQEVLSEITYKVTDKAGKDVTKEAKDNHIWGTGFDDSNVSQIYEPLFTLQESQDGTSYQSIANDSYKLVSGKKYRVIYDGKKAVFNANGTYSHRTQVNDRNDINGVDYNYQTDATPTAADKALAVEVTPGTEAEIDITALLGEKKGAKTIGELTAKEYDGKPVYGAKSEYKNNVSLKAKDGGAKLTTLLKEFSFQWYRYRSADDLLDAQIQDENQKNEFDSWGPADEGRWYEISNVSPQDAGVYKLVINYNDMTDDGKLYYVKEPAVVYYAIDPMKVKIVPDVPEGAETYETFSGREIWKFFAQNEIKYSIQKAAGESKESPIVSGQTAEVHWQVVETTQQEAPAEPSVMDFNEDDGYAFVNDAKVSYELRGNSMYVYDSVNYEYDESANYTCIESKKIYTEETAENGAKRADREDKSLNTATAPIKVKAMGTTKLTIVVDQTKWTAKEKVYDGQPFKLDELVTEGLITVKEADTGKVITDQGLLDQLSYKAVRIEPWQSDYYSEIKDIIGSGAYELYACFDGNETYAPIRGAEGDDSQGTKLGTFKITKRPVTLQVDLPENYTAGVTAEGILNAIPGHITVDGYLADDEWAFTEQKYWMDGTQYFGIPAWSDSFDSLQEPSFLIYEKGSRTPLNDGNMLRKDTAYEVKYDAENSSLSEEYNVDDGYEYVIDFSANYEVNVTTAAEFNVVRGNSYIKSVEGTDGTGELQPVVIKNTIDDKDNMKHVVTIQEGIGYSSFSGEEEMLEGHLVEFRITPPAEYGGIMPSTARYYNELKEKCSYVYGTEEYIYAVFDADEGDKTFKIRWEDGYVETYELKLDDAVKLGSLKEAVAPKSLAFNAPDKKMAVGQSQQLDVKITKVQMGDVICLGYKSGDEKVLTVNENGYVTALKVGKANITVFPQRYVKGKLEPIPGAKEASVTITATKVTAPKTVKVTAHGTYADLNYDSPKDGYRREIYVVDNTKNASLKKAADIEKLVTTVKEDQWKDNFAIAPVYLDSADESYNRIRNGYTVRLFGLEVTGTYTVYVRNVCAARTLPDGSTITESTVNESAAGTAVNFKTLKSEIVDIHLTVDESGEGVKDITKPEDIGGEGYFGHMYRVELSKLAKGTVDCVTFGEYLLSVKDKTADAGDTFYRPLPLSDKKYFEQYDQDDKNYYEEPKLEYTLANCWNKKTERYEYGQKNDIASIDKKGKIKITGITGEDRYLRVRVRDTVTGQTAYAGLHIVADADSVAAKKKSVSLSVGQTQNLNSMLTYKMGKQNLTSYPNPDVDMDAVRKAIKDQSQEKFFELDAYGYLKAIEKGGNLRLDLIDKNVEKTSGKEKATAAVTFRSTDLVPVKKLKAFDVIDDSFGLTFTYAGGADAFLLEISDANKLIYSKKFMNSSVFYDSDNLNAWEVWENSKRVKDTYRIDAVDITRYVKLTKETQYNIKLTALYDTIAAKPASTRVKTTKIPAVDAYISDNYYDDEEQTIKHRGGMSIQVAENNGGKRLNESNTSLRVLSGNSYTLTAEVQNRGRVNDTLVWTVNNGKIASVKAAAGSYCITLKGLKPGSTVLEVKSKIWGNKVVARYDIRVVAVGDAYQDTNRYFGDNEPGDWTDSNLNNGGNGAPVYLPLSLGDQRKVTINQTEYFSFTAPESARYRIRSIGYVGDSVYFRKTSYPTKYGYSSLDLGWLQAGEKINIYSQAYPELDVSGNTSYYVEVELTQRMETVQPGEAMKFTGKGQEEYFMFTAPETASYEFFLTDEYGRKQYLYLYGSMSDISNDYSYIESGSYINYEIQKDGSVWIKTEYLYSGTEYTLNISKSSMDLSLAGPVDVTIASNGKKQLLLTMEKDGFYKFSSEGGASYNARAILLVNGQQVDSIYNSIFEMKQELHEGDQVCLQIENYSSYEDLSLKISAEEIIVGELTTDAELPVEDGGCYQFTASEAGIFELALTDSGASMKLFTSQADAMKNNYNYVKNDNYIEYSMEKSDTVWIVVQLNGAEDCKLSVAKIDQKMDFTTPFDVKLGAGKKLYLELTVPQDGYYSFSTDAASNSDCMVAIKVNDSSESWSAINDFDVKKELTAGDTVKLTLTNSGTADVSFKVTAEEVVIEEMPATAELSTDNDQFYKFTASEAGDYEFTMSSASENTSLYIYGSISNAISGSNWLSSAQASQDQENTSIYKCTIETVSLDAGQTVYIKPHNDTGSALEVTLSASKAEVTS